MWGDNLSDSRVVQVTPGCLPSYSWFPSVLEIPWQRGGGAEEVSLGGRKCHIFKFHFKFLFVVVFYYYRRTRTKLQACKLTGNIHKYPTSKYWLLLCFMFVLLEETKMGSKSPNKSQVFILQCLKQVTHLQLCITSPKVFFANVKTF